MLSGVAATRCSCGRRSLMMATFIAARFLALPARQGNETTNPAALGESAANHEPNEPERI
jgi:hypothetical protein